MCLSTKVLPLIPACIYMYNPDTQQCLPPTGNEGTAAEICVCTKHCFMMATASCSAMVLFHWFERLALKAPCFSELLHFAG